MHTGMLADIFGVDGIIVIVVVAIVLLFGGTQLPKLARGLGSASHEFKKGIEEGEPKTDPASAAATPTVVTTPAVAPAPVVVVAEQSAPAPLPASTVSPEVSSAP